MAKIRAYTTIEQSRKLAEILSSETADMHYHYDYDFDELESIPTITEEDNHFSLFTEDVRCWSLAALFSVLPFHLIINNQRYAFGMYKGLNKYGETYTLSYNVFNTDVCLYSTDYYNNLVDACVEMIEKLHERKLL